MRPFRSKNRYPFNKAFLLKSGGIFIPPKNVVFSGGNQPPKTLSKNPAAMAEPMTPATFGPIACMSRKFVLL